jgi:hypothetical protein
MIVGTRRRRIEGVRAMRRTITGIVLTVLTLAVLVPGSPAHAVTSAPQLTIAPAGPYLDRQPVHVTGTGLRPGADLRVAECESAGICDWWNGPSGTVAADGTIAFDVELTRYMYDYFSSVGDTPIDCAVYRCLLGLVEEDAPDIFDEYAVRAFTQLPFSNVPPVLPDVHVAPTTDLPAIATLDVQASGFTPERRVVVRFCTSTPDGCSTVDDLMADADGRVATTVTVHRLGLYWDCVETSTCALALYGFRPGDQVVVPLSFDPDAPVTRPTLHLDRDQNLALRDAVYVRGTDFPPSTDVRVSQCAGSSANPFPTYCPSVTEAIVRTDDSGSLSATIPVRRYIDNSAFFQPVDCADADACYVQAYAGATLPPTHAPIRFARHTADAAVTIGSTEIVEGTGDPRTIARIPVTLDHPAPTSVWVDWFAGGELFESARVNDDYVYSRGTVWIPAGTTRATITIPIVADALDEPTESFTLLGTRVDGARFADGGSRATETILDDDRRPKVDIANTLVREHAGSASVPLRLSEVSGRDVTVTYVTHHASARSGEDFVRTKGSIIVPAYWLGTRIHIPIVDDHREEPGERFWVEVTGAHNGVVRTGRADVWIGDDD